MGHLLGAAGAIEALICVKALQEQVIPPSINVENGPELPAGGPQLATRGALEVPLTAVMSNSFGFGGPCASLVFSRYRG